MDNVPHVIFPKSNYPSAKQFNLNSLHPFRCMEHGISSIDKIQP